MIRKTPALLVLGGLLLTGLTAVPAAQAATYTSTGARCTITGTAGVDKLTGTGGRDVICGLGGNDLIAGRGGNDLVEGGAGADTVNGGDGADVLRGGLGADELAGAAGTDTVVGGAQGDEITGGGGGDDLDGNGGNDDLSGDAGADDLDGDAGTNWCTVGANDTQDGCKYDTEAPATDRARLSTDRVDVTRRNEYLTVRVHVTDDTGVADVNPHLVDDATNTGTLHGYARLVEGTVRDGTWEADIVVARWSEPAEFVLSVNVRDRVGRRTEQRYAGQVLTVVDDNPDVDLPVARLISPTPDATYDVRDAGQDVVVKARITDAVSGVWYADLCLSMPRDGFYGGLPCEPAELVSGDEHDGVWKAVLRVPKGEVGGDWNVEVGTIDWAHKSASSVRWMGPDLYRYWTNGGTSTDPWVQEFRDGMGRFSVIGRRDSVAPTLESFAMTPDHVETLNGQATVEFTVHATDPEGVTAVGLALNSTTNPDNDLFGIVDLQLTGGTDTDGTWTGTLTLPQGSPPDTYAVQAWVEDTTHFRSYVSASSRYAGDADQALLAGDPKLVVGDGGGA